MSPPSTAKSTPHIPLATATSATTEKVKSEESELMAAHALVEMANAGLTGSDIASALAAKADAGNESNAAEASKYNDNKADDAIKPPKPHFLLKLGGHKNVEEEKKPPQDAAETRTYGPREPRESATEPFLIGPATTGVVGSEKASTPPMETGYEIDKLAMMIAKFGLLRGNYNISDDALKFLGQAVRQFVLDLLQTHKREEANDPIKAQQRVLAEEREAERRRMQQWNEERLAGALKRLRDDMEREKQPGESEETRLLRGAIEREAVAMYEDMYRRPSSLATPAKSGSDTTYGLRGQVAETTLVGSLATGTTGSEKGFRLTTRSANNGDKGPLGKVEGERSEDPAKVQKLILKETDRGLDQKKKQDAMDVFKDKISKRLIDKAVRVSGTGEVRETPLAPNAAQRAATSVPEFASGPTTDANKPVGPSGDKATRPEEPGKPQPVVVNNPPQHRSPLRTTHPLEQKDAWRARSEKRSHRTNITTKTTQLRPKTVAFAKEAVDNVKLQGSSVGPQQPTVEKLDASKTRTTPAATADEVLASVFYGIDISRPEKPSATNSKPQHQPPSNTNALSNPFFRSDMTIAIAAQNIAAYFREAADWLTFWHISTCASALVDMSHKLTSTLNLIFNHLKWTAEFLRLGRAGWDLRCLPDNFFEDVLPLIMVTCGKLEKLGEWKGCGGMMIGAWRDAEEVGEMLATVRNVRVRDDRKK